MDEDASGSCLTPTLQRRVRRSAMGRSRSDMFVMFALLTLPFAVAAYLPTLFPVRNSVVTGMKRAKMGLSSADLHSQSPINSQWGGGWTTVNQVNKEDPRFWDRSDATQIASTTTAASPRVRETCLWGLSAA